MSWNLLNNKFEKAPRDRRRLLPDVKSFIGSWNNGKEQCKRIEGQMAAKSGAEVTRLKIARWFAIDKFLAKTLSIQSKRILFFFWKDGEYLSLDELLYSLSQPFTEIVFSHSASSCLQFYPWKDKTFTWKMEISTGNFPFNHK